MREKTVFMLLEWGKELILALLVLIGSSGVQAVRDIRTQNAAFGEKLDEIIRIYQTNKEETNRRLDNHELRISGLEHDRHHR